MSKPIWFPFYPADFLTSNRVALMTTEEIGGYTLLLCYAWQDPNCTLPADDESIRKLSRLTGSLEAVKSCFIQKRGRLLNERLYKEWVKVKEKSDLAKHSSEVRWNNERNANALRTQSSSHRNIGTEEQKNKGTEEESESQSEITNQKKIKTSASASPRGTGKSVEVANSSPVWDAYAESYTNRYGVLPVRNAKVNSCLKSFMSRVPEEEAPDIASFYVRHPGAYYVSRGHPVELLLRDAEKIRTEWASNRPITQRQAQQSDGQAARGQVWKELIDEAEAKKGTA
jgi:uncharacterized protein YdaU (DUF1376 family)